MEEIIPVQYLLEYEECVPKAATRCHYQNTDTVCHVAMDYVGSDLKLELIVNETWLMGEKTPLSSQDSWFFGPYLFSES